MKRMMLLATLVMMTFVSGYAKEPSQVEKMVSEIAEKYENTEGVNCYSITKGIGLSMIKKKLKKQLGKEFMKGITGITIIDYSKASEDICQALRADFEAFAPLLEEIKTEKDGQSDDNDYKRCFTSISPENSTLSDFVIALEDEESKFFVHMAGDINIESYIEQAQK